MAACRPRSIPSEKSHGTTCAPRSANGWLDGAGAGRQVEHPLARPRVDGVHDDGAPAAVLAERQHVVGQVVAAGHASNIAATSAGCLSSCARVTAPPYAGARGLRAGPPSPSRRLPRRDVSPPGHAAGPPVRRPTARRVRAARGAHRAGSTDAGPLLALLPDAPDATAWVRRGEGLVGWGVAARAAARRAPTGSRDAKSWWAEHVRTAVVRDEVDQPGTGVVCFGSFAFADAPGRQRARGPRGRRRPPRRHAPG